MTSSQAAVSVELAMAVLISLSVCQGCRSDTETRPVGSANQDSSAYTRAFETPLPRIVAVPRGKPAQPFKGEYDFTAEWDYFGANIPVWGKVLAPFKGKPNIRYLEIGVFEGRSSIWMLENILTHPSARLTGVDVFFDYKGVKGETLKQRYLDNVRRAGATDKLTLLVGYSQEKLRELSLESFDIIYIDGGHSARDVLEDAILSWRLLKSGGILMFDDYEHNLTEPHRVRPMLGINVFFKLYGSQFDLVHREFQVILRKR